eukprot:8204931-Ditylum_brightwellii.AAC.1
MENLIFNSIKKVQVTDPTKEGLFPIQALAACKPSVLTQREDSLGKITESECSCWTTYSRTFPSNVLIFVLVEQKSAYLYVIPSYCSLM